MSTEQMITLMEGLQTKDELRDFARETFGHEFKSRDTVEQMRETIKQLINGEPLTAESTADGTENKLHGDPDGGDTDSTKTEGGTASAKSTTVRLLRNTRNGRTVAWTKDLAKRPHMEEVN